MWTRVQQVHRVGPDSKPDLWCPGRRPTLFSPLRAAASEGTSDASATSTILAPLAANPAVFSDALRVITETAKALLPSRPLTTCLPRRPVPPMTETFTRGDWKK